MLFVCLLSKGAVTVKITHSFIQIVRFGSEEVSRECEERERDVVLHSKFVCFACFYVSSKRGDE